MELGIKQSIERRHNELMNEIELYLDGLPAQDYDNLIAAAECALAGIPADGPVVEAFCVAMAERGIAV